MARRGTNIHRTPSGRYRARYWTPDGRERNKTFDTYAEAQKFQASMTVDKARGVYVEPTKMTFREWAEEWRANQEHHRQSTKEGVEVNLRANVYPYLGDRLLVSIERSTVQAWVRGRVAEGKAPRTIRLIFAWINTIMKEAVLDGYLKKNPCERVKLPEMPDTEARIPTDDEVEAIAAAVPERFQTAVMVAAQVGVRQAELFGLTVDRLDTLRRVVRIDRQLLGRTPEGLPVFGEPKTKRSKRTVPVAAVTVELLAAHLATFPTGDSGLIFTMSNGSPVTRTRWGEVLRKARGEHDLPILGLHSMRHYCASKLLSEGVSVKAVSDFLGHASATETLDTYAHLMPNDPDRIRAVIQGAWTNKGAVRAQIG